MAPRMIHLSLFACAMFVVVSSATFTIDPEEALADTSSGAETMDLQPASVPGSADRGGR
jgi:hypothetical protein